MAVGHKIYVLDSFNAPPGTERVDPQPLDMEPGFSFELTDTVAEVSDLNKIKQEGVLGFSIPATARNKRMLEKYVGFGITDQNFDGVQVEAWAWGYKLNQDRLFVLSFERGVFQCEIRVSGDWWVEQAKTLALSSLDLGTFEFTEANIEANWSGNFQYSNDDTVFFPLVDYGRFDGEDMSSVDHEYFRPLHSVLAVLKAGFCAMNKGFRSPFMESTRGRRLWAYLLDNEFYNQIPDNGATYYGLGLTFDTLTSNWTTDDLGSEIGPVTNQPASPQVSFTMASDRDLLYEFCFEGTISNTTGSTQEYYWEVFYSDGSNLYSLYQSPTIQVLAGSSATDDFCSGDILLPQGAEINILFNGSVGGITPVTGYSVTGRPKKKSIILGTTFNCADVLPDDEYFIDFLAGVVHLIDGKLWYDRINETIWLFTPNDTTINSSEVDGFIQSKESSIEVSHRMLTGDEVISYPASRDTRYLRLKFKDSTDAYIESLELDEPYGSRLIDFGEERGRLNEEEISANPFFEPTIERQVYEFNSTLLAPYLPVMWDNEEGEISYSIGPRILYANGYQEQRYYFDGADCEWNLNGVVQTNIPYATSIPNLLWGGPPGNPPFAPVYGTYGEDFYEYAWKYSIARLDQGLRMALPLLTSINEYVDPWKFRRLYQLHIMGQTITARLVRLERFRTDMTEPATAIFEEEKDAC
jgi:hypothetical protein